MRAWLIGVSSATVLLAGILATVPLAGANHQPRATPSGTPIVGSPLLQPGIDLVEAQEIALEGQGGAHVAEIDLDAEHGLLTYRIELDNGVDVEIDATTGEILRTEHDEHPGHDTSARRGDRDDDDWTARRHDRDDGRSARWGHDRRHDD
jgi:hypothetical protein